MKNFPVFIFLLLVSSAYCQTEESPQKIWSTIGTGGYKVTGRPYREGFAFNFSADFLKNKNYWKARYIHSEEFNLFVPTPNERYNDIGLLYGWISRSKFVRLSFSGGIGVLTGIERGELISSSGSRLFRIKYEEKHFSSIAIPLEIELSLIPSKYFGIGASGFANLNFHNSLVGFIIKLEFGKLR